MIGHGVVIDPSNAQYGAPPIELLRELGVSLVRQGPTFDTGFEAYQPLLVGAQSAFVFTPQSFATSEWDKEAATCCGAYRPAIAVLLNETDAYLDGQEHDASGPMAPSEYRRYWDWIAPSIRAASPSTQLCIAGQMFWTYPYVGRWLSELFGAGPLQLATLAGLHIYQMTDEPKVSEMVHNAIATVRAITKLDVYVDEWTVPDEDVIRVARQLRRECVASTWFCESEGMVEGHGLRDLDGSAFPTFYALKAGLMPASYAGV